MTSTPGANHRSLRTSNRFYLGCLVVALALGFCPWSPSRQATAAEIPQLAIARTPGGLDISWNADVGDTYVLQASDELSSNAWSEVMLPMIQTGAVRRVTVPTAQVQNYYRLLDQGGLVIKPTYVGASACSGCHNGIYTAHVDGGHPYKLNKVEGGTPPTYPYTTVPNVPDGYTWDDISYVIGGANWKARFIDLDGYIITGTNVQWNLATEDWVAYHGSEAPGTKPYNCGRCHTTGWVSTDDGAAHQDGLAGMAGSFVAPGVQCEECHGAGSRHIQTMSANDIDVMRSAAQCGKCHYRNEDHTIAAKGGFIRHHEQYDEMIAAGHVALACIDCHDPHKTVRHGQTGGIIRSCEDCHQAYASTTHHGATCVECHMGKASKSAVAENQYTGDIRTHIFKINTSATGEMFNVAGTLANNAVTLDFACYGCHSDTNGIGGGGLERTMEQLAAKADGFHTSFVPAPEPAYVGSSACSGCHKPIYDKLVQGGHPYKLNKVVDDLPPTYPFTTVSNVPAGYAWTDISYVIGGANWKARFIDQDGYIITGSNVQWNLQTETWSGYHADEDPGTKPYNCGRCHTTGWVSTDDGGGNQDDLPGMHGSFSEPGIWCEACHGPGGTHVTTMKKSDISIRRSAAQCGECHYRNEDHTIAAKGGFIRHHEQYDEMIAAGHVELTCIDCHDPHTTVKHGQPGGIIRDCIDCHARKAVTDHHGATCVDCHMGKASKSAVAVNQYTGDIRTHIFAINTSSTGEMFNVTGTLANDAVTLDFACYGCHSDTNGIGGGGSEKTLEQLSGKAEDFHSAY